MNRSILTILGFCLVVVSLAQVGDHGKLIELGRAYKDFMFRNDPNKDDLKQIRSNVPPELAAATEFIVQTITTRNKLLTRQFLERPADEVLEQVFIIRAINHNLRKEDRVDDRTLIDSLSTASIPTYQLVDSYYDMLFTGVGNKNQPFDLTKVDLKLNEYKLKDDTEKGIFFLKCMDLCGTTIWGYMNIVDPPNTQKAYDHIKKFPKVNGRAYYQYTDLYFPDFEMEIEKDKGMQSYKGYYINKYYGTLLSHLICLKKENAPEKEVNDLLLESILKDNQLYKYTSYEELLRSIFQEQKD